MCSEDDEDRQMVKDSKSLLERLEALKNEGAATAESKHIGYDPEDFQYTSQTYPNCTTEFVSPKGYVREKFTRPKVWPKQYKFTLDKF